MTPPLPQNLFDYSLGGLRVRLAVSDVGFLRVVDVGPSDGGCDSGSLAEGHCPIFVQGEDGVHRATGNLGRKQRVSIPGKDLVFQSHSTEEVEDGLQLEWTLAGGGLEVVLHWKLHQATPVLRAWMTVTNRGPSDHRLDAVSPLMLHALNAGGAPRAWEQFQLHLPHNSWSSELQWRTATLTEHGLCWAREESSQRIVASNTGTWSSKEMVPMAVLTDPFRDLAWAWQIESGGSWAWEISDFAHDLYLNAGLLDEEHHHWTRNLRPGESFTTFPVALTCVRGGFDSAIRALTRYRRILRRPHPDNEKLPVIFNDYMHALYADPSTEKERPLIAVASEVGCEIFMIDAGWYAPPGSKWWDTVGEWQPCHERFEGGLDGILGEIREAGMVPGLWLELESMGVSCPLAATWPDECFFVRHGKRVSPRGRLQLDFRHPIVRAHADEVIDRLVLRHGVGYIKMDYNNDAGPGTDWDADSPGDGLLQHLRAYLQWLEDVFDRHPHLVVENCGSGGLRMDYALMRLHSIVSSSDQEDALFAARIAASSATAAPPEQIAMWSYPLPGDNFEKIVFTMVNSLLGRMILSGRPDQLSKEGRAIVAAAVDFYKSHRDFIRKAEPFWPLGLPRPGDKVYAAGLEVGGEILLSIWNLGDSAVSLDERLTGFTDVQVAFPAGNTSSFALPPGPSARVFSARRRRAPDAS